MSRDNPQPSETQTNAEPATGRPWTRELRLAAIVLVASLAIMPALIYAVGRGLFGAYSGGEHIGFFYGNFVRNLASGTLRTWSIVLAPYLFLWVLRAIFWPWGQQLPPLQKGPKQEDGPDKTAQPPRPAAQTGKVTTRREPFITP